MKRSYSDSDSEDGFDQHSDKYPASSTQGGHGPDRKRRRGVIEKRRRDRINSSLSELRRLVPSAFEKQGSAKLEKAEILQMTVDHLKMLHAKGLNNYNFDPATLAMDYRSVGFRECMTEVSRYLLTSEGLDIQDPLRLRMIGHLQCYSTQREVASKHASLNPTFQGGSWNSMSAHPSWNSQYNTNSMGGMGVHGGGQADHTQLLSSNSISSGVHSSANTDNSRVHPHMDNHMRLSSSGGNGPAQLHSSCPTSQPLPQVHTQFPVSLSVNSVSMLSPSHNYTSNSFPLSQAAGVRHYRPWGAELAF